MKQKIVGFHRDKHADWVADLQCGHTQHEPHRPPWQQRPWVTTSEGRRSRLGIETRLQKVRRLSINIKSLRVDPSLRQPSFRMTTKRLPLCLPERQRRISAKR